MLELNSKVFRIFRTNHSYPLAQFVGFFFEKKACIVKYTVYTHVRKEVMTNEPNLNLLLCNDDITTTRALADSKVIR